MIKELNITNEDKKRLKDINIDKSALEDNFFDYSKVVVKKPWGYEYLIYQNGITSVWILYIKRGFQTSMHCHPNKKTSLIVLSGKAVCSTLNEKMKLGPAEGLLIHKAVFHSTKSISKEGTIVMETETSTNKRDLVRLIDKYGRKGMGYESIENMSFNLQNYNYISLIDSQVFYNIKKKFGKCSISLAKIRSEKELAKILKLNGKDIINILKGEIYNKNKKILLEVGDICEINRIKPKKLLIEDEIDIIIIKKIDNIIKVSDYIISFFEKQKVKNIFLVPGSTNVHLLDSVGRNTNIGYICTQTEQAASLAAESYAKLTGNLGVCVISSGTAGTNAMIGVADAWIDSTPLVIISGQCQSDQISDGKLRQLGVQELDIISPVKPVTKYAAKIDDPYKIKYHLEKATFLANNERPGPVWIDIPIDIQGMNIDEEELMSFNPNEIKKHDKSSKLRKQILATVDLIKNAKRPVILAGNGVRLSNAKNDFMKLIKILSIPILTSKRGADIIPDNHPLFFGRPGAYGQRSSNFILQNADLLISIGSRLSMPQIGRNFKAFAREAKKIVVDIDESELKKPTINPDIAIKCNAKDFIVELLKSFSNTKKIEISEWIYKCNEFKSKFSDTIPSEINDNYINAYNFVNHLSNELREGAIITVDGGSPIIYLMQAFKFKKNQRLISATGLDNYSFALPASIGACIANHSKSVICLCEDSGFLKHVQELETIVNYKLPVKIFILNSGGYSYVRKTQKEYFGGRFIASERAKHTISKYLQKIGKAYGISTYKINNERELKKTLSRALVLNEAVICEVNIDNDQQITPRIVFTVKPDGKWVAKPLEDMYPFLDRKTFKENMIIRPLEED